MQDDGASKSQRRTWGAVWRTQQALAEAPTGPQKQKKIDSKLMDAKIVGKEVCRSLLLQFTMLVCVCDCAELG